MARVEKTIEVNVPVRTAYNQWTQFEEFPNFMEGVEEVTQLDDKRLHWRAKVAGKEHEWDAVIREQVPDEKVIWKNTSGAENAGMVTFDNLGANKTRVHLEMSYDPEGFIENLGDMLGFVSRRVEGDLERFKDFIESRNGETGQWRGEIENPDAPGGHTRGDTSTQTSGKGQGQHGNIEGDEPKPSGWALHDSDSTTDDRSTSSSAIPDTGSHSRTEARGTLGASGYGEGSERPLGVIDPQGNLGRGAGNAPANRQNPLPEDSVSIDTDADPDLDRGTPDPNRRDMR